jgi:hypothetical protein
MEIKTKHNMKKTIIILASSIITFSCSNKPDDFIGVHSSYKTESCQFIDTTEIVRSFFSNSYLKISSAKLVPIKIDIFKNGEEIKGTFSVVNIKGYENSKDGSVQQEIKVDLSNLHIVNDTLICEMKQSFLFTTVSNDIKLSKKGGKISITLPANKKDSIFESCNKFVSSVTKNTITYLCEENTSTYLTQSNECLAEKTYSEVSPKYNKSKLDYLKSLLKSNIK